MLSLSPDELIRRIQDRLVRRAPPPAYGHFDLAPAPTEPAPFALIVGAGFSYGVVPLVRELMHETIGDYYFPDQDQSSMRRPPEILRRNSADFWAELNAAAARKRLPLVSLNEHGLPADPGAAYQELFTFQAAEALFTPAADEGARKPTYLEKLLQARAARGQRTPASPSRGTKFVKGFLRYVLDPGSEHGHGATGRNALNDAHSQLAALLCAQQEGRLAPFCRTILTTNFDTLLQNALQSVRLLYRLTDRPDRGLDRSDLEAEESAIHLVYTHGSILRHDPASSIAELDDLAALNAEALRAYLRTRDVLTIGYSGWNDSVFTALKAIEAPERHLYWCDVLPEPPSHVQSAFAKWGEQAAYVNLGRAGADGLMRGLREALAPVT